MTRSADGLRPLSQRAATTPGCEAALGGGAAAVASALAAWQKARGTQRLWAGDASLWSDADEAQWLGWLRAPQTTREQLGAIEGIAAECAAAGLRDTVVLGMGGSSLFPDVLARTFGGGDRRLLVVDSTDPQQIAATQASLRLEQTVFIVASKSGGTIEPNTLMAHFAAATASARGAAAVGSHFIAITDPGSSLEAHAREHGFRATSYGVPSIGGRFSALSPFGMLPAALLGLDVAGLLARAERMASACARDEEVERNPGVWLGVALGALAAEGRDKLTLCCTPALASVGAWLEQLIAESSGKHGHGIVPVDGEALVEASCYGDDRVFVAIELATAPDATRAAALDALTAAGHPVVRITLAEPADLAGEVFRWEIATAAACAVLGVNAFDQPDVEAAKVAARRRMDASGANAPVDSSDAEARAWARHGSLQLFADPALAAEAAGESLDAALKRHLARLAPGDYFAVNAFIAMLPEHEAALQRLRDAVCRNARVATSVGFGPRFLHSTGQLHKGGPPSGVFLQITADCPADLPIPGEALSFGQLARAQALGDFDVLVERGRRALHVHIAAESPDEVTAGLERLADAIEDALR